MNTLQKFIVGSVLVLAIGCSKDNKEETIIAQPKIESVEIGLQNSKKAYTESDLHLEAVITAEAGIKKVEVQVIPEQQGPSAFVVTETYTKAFIGKKEAHLHQHYDIPKNAKEGTYQVVITVWDEKNQKATHTDILTIEKDPTLPTATDKTAAYANDTLKITAKINAPNKIASISIRVKEITQTYDTDDVVGQTEYALDKEINVASLPNGHYHFFVTIKDQADKVLTYEGHFDKK